MNRDLEAAILKRALERGLISADQLSQLEEERSVEVSGGEREKQSRIERLIEKGFISQDSVAALEDELKRDIAVSSTVTLPGRVESDSSDEEETTPVGQLPKGHAAPSRGRAAVLPTFSSSQVLAERYRIVRFVAQGGMGEVYEAQDLELHERVALKTVRPEIAEDEKVMERFKREIHLARRVTHPNVCRIFDIARHRPTPQEGSGRFAGEISFLTMELLEGQTLAERLRATGLMPAEEALPIVSQMVAALSAAHKAGIIHRDFKSGNVILVPTKEESEGIRAVVTDFGLARSSVGGDSFASSVSATGEVMGTPAYMAPEQVEGLELSPAADIYALGVVMYEMVTGTQPFVGDTPIGTMVKRLSESPPSPRTHVPDLDPKWEFAILRCLERDPADRFERVADVLKALGGEEVTASKRALEEARQRAAAAARKQRQRLVVSAVAALIILIAGVGYYFLVAKRLNGPASSGTAIPKARRAIAVLGFKNLSGRQDAGWLSTALAEMLSTELAAGEKLRTIPGENVARMKIELSLVEAESFAQETLARIRSNLGTDLVVLGSYLALGEKPGSRQIRLDLRLQDATAGEIIAIKETGMEAQLFDLVSRAGTQLRSRLGVGELSPAEAGSVRASLPSNSDAARLYAEGLQKLRVFEALAARELLEKAIAADPNYPLAHSALAAAWSSLGYDAKAKEEAKKAFDLSANLSREERLSVEGRYYDMTRQWDKAVENYRTLAGLFPDNLEYGLRLASAQTSSGKGKDALVTLEALQKLPPPVSEDARIDLAETLAARSTSDNKRAQAAAAKAAEKGQAQGARLLVARARFDEGSALQNLGELDKAKAALEEAERMFAEAGDRRGRAGALNNISLVLANRGDVAGARKLSEEALALYREIGNKSGEALMLSNMGNIRYIQGDLSGAQKLWEQTLTTYREINEKDGVARMLNNIASARADQGDMSGAKKKFEEALAVYREIGNKLGVAVALGNIGKALYDQGDLARGKKMYEEALAILREIGDKSYIASNLSDYADILFAEDDLSGARKSHEEALAIRTEIGESAAARNRLALAELLLEEGRASDAEAAAAAAAEQSQKDKSSDDEASAREVVARSLLAQRRTDDAQKAIAQATSLTEKSENRGLRVSVAITAARIRAASGKSAEALKSLGPILADARKAELLRSQFEARLALGEIEVASGKAAAGRARLAALEAETKSKGFGLVARKAAALRK